MCPISQMEKLSPEVPRPLESPAAHEEMDSDRGLPLPCPRHEAELCISGVSLMPQRCPTTKVGPSRPQLPHLQNRRS